MSSPLDDFISADWNGDILPRLTKFTNSLVRYYTWSSHASLPKGLQVEDIVVEAVAKTLAGLKGDGSGKGVRKWNRDTCPSLLEFLMGVVRSDISALAKSGDHQLTDRESENFELDEVADPASEVTANSRYEELMTRLRPRVENDAEVQQLLQAMEILIGEGEDAGSEVIMGLTGFTYPQYRNARRRLQAAVAVLEKEGG